MEIPLRVDFDLHRESRIEALAAWENSPTSIAAMVLYDGTAGRLSATAAKLVGKSTEPADVHAAFDSACGDFWYFLLYCDAKLRRGAHWNARSVFHSEVVDALFHLLRIEAGGAALEHWNWKHNAFGIERTVSTARLAELDNCIPAPGIDGLRLSMLRAARLASSVCDSIADTRAWDWPSELATQTMAAIGRD
jgi:hypothetical protein